MVQTGNGGRGQCETCFSSFLFFFERDVSLIHSQLLAFFFFFFFKEQYSFEIKLCLLSPDNIDINARHARKRQGGRERLGM